MSLTISAIQYNIKWEEKNINLNKIEILLNDVPNHTEVIILPEMFTTGFSMNTAKLAETMNGKTVKWMQKQSKSLNKVIAGSIIIKEQDTYRNRFLWIEPNGKVQFYDKRHSFGLGDEDQYFSNGNKRVIIEYKDWKIFPTICYDLRFPEWIKNNIGYDLIINVANWPSVRSSHWKNFLISRAVENQSYLIGLNRIGTDAKNRHYSGYSAIIDCDGKVLNNIGEIEGIITATLSKKALYEYRNNYPFLKDQDVFELNL